MFALLFEDSSSGALATAPPGARGPRYTITWTFPNGAGNENKVRQSVLPYAAGGPLTFMASGQPVLDTTTKGFWYRAGDDLISVPVQTRIGTFDRSRSREHSTSPSTSGSIRSRTTASGGSSRAAFTPLRPSSSA